MAQIGRRGLHAEDAFEWVLTWYLAETGSFCIFIRTQLVNLIFKLKRRGVNASGQFEVVDSVLHIASRCRVNGAAVASAPHGPPSFQYSMLGPRN